MTDARKLYVDTSESDQAAETAPKTASAARTSFSSSMLWEPQNYALVRAAARASGLGIAQFIRVHTLAAARALLRDIQAEQLHDEGPGVPLLGAVKFDSVSKKAAKR
jgi:hypothetical protein